MMKPPTRRCHRYEVTGVEKRNTFCMGGQVEFADDYPESRPGNRG